MSWQNAAIAGFAALWVALVIAVDFPLYTETQSLRNQLEKNNIGKSATARRDTKQSTPFDPTHEFIASLPAFDKCTEQLRALNQLANKSGVLIASAHYRYEPVSGLPLMKAGVIMDVRGSEKQQRRFLRMILNAFPNLAISRLGYSRGTDGANNLREKFDIDMYYKGPSNSAV